MRAETFSGKPILENPFEKMGGGNDNSPLTALPLLIARQAQRYPHQIAIKDEQHSWSYGRLLEAATALSRRLEQEGVVPGDFVGVCAERTAEVIIEILGILICGAAYVPLDPAYPRERLEFMIEDSAIRLILISAGSKSLFSTCRARLLEPSEALEHASGTAADLPLAAGDPNSTAYIIYTSGSTGTPKGVCCHHRGVVNLLEDFQRRQPLDHNDTGSWWTSLSFDVSVYEIFSPLTAGATLHIVPESIRADAPALMAWLQRHNITSAYIPPFMVADLASWAKRQGSESQLRRLLVGVEPIPERLLREIDAAIPALRIINGYGPSEATICATLYSVEANTPSHENTPIGTAVRNLQIYLLDSDGNPVPEGEVGEIVIGGAGVAHGYHKRPDLTSERFMPDPHSANSTARLYKTGDTARRLADGNLMFVGRSDFQVKLHGYRVELGEIETALRRHAEIREAIVLVREDVPGYKHLVAYVVFNDNADCAADSLRGLLRQTLPDYMVPSVFIRLDQIPSTTNGKSDRRALPKPIDVPDRQLRCHLYHAPQSPTQHLICQTFSELLQHSQIGVRDNFFELGGNSLMAAQVCSRLHNHLRKSLDLSTFFAHPTPESLAMRLDGQSQHDEAPAKIVRHNHGQDPTPASYQQLGMWMVEQLHAHGALYNIPLAIQIRGALRPKLLERVLNHLVAHHDILRTGFAVAEGKLYQHVAKELSLELPVTVLMSLDSQQRENRFQQLVDKAGQRVFALDKPPLLQAHLVQMESTHFRLLLTFHHSVIDGWGVGIFLQELGALYEALLRKETISPPQHLLQYSDYCHWQQEYLTGSAALAALTYWRQQLPTTPPQLILQDALYDSETDTGARETLCLSPALSRTLEEFAQTNQVSVCMVLMAAFQSLLHLHSGQNDIITGTVSANRPLPELETIVGAFINALPIRTRFDDDPNVGALLQRVRQTSLEAFDKQSVPFEWIAEHLQPEQNKRPLSFFQTSLIFQNMPMPPMRFGELDLSLTEVGNHSAKLDILATLEKHESSIRGWFEYRTCRFAPSTIRRLIADFCSILEQIIANPRLRISSLAAALPSMAATPTASGPNCYLIGETSLLVRCAQMLLERGFRIEGVISPDAANRDWAQAHGILAYAYTQNLGEILQAKPFDYLFSVVNSAVLPGSILELPRRLAINYHDAPLPAYAGVHATSWALLNGEETHGITWHVMKEKLDSGDILQQVPVSISPGDTAFSLNTKCYEAAQTSFATLADQLAGKAPLQRSPQNLGQRSYFSLYRRPEAGGLLLWDQEAARLQRLVRALDFGETYPNPLLLPKLMLKKRLVTVRRLECRPATGPEAPGTLIDVASQALVVSTADAQAAILEVSELDGTPLTLATLIQEADLQPGMVLPLPNADERQRLTESTEKLARHESFWQRRLAALDPVALPLPEADDVPACQLEISLPGSVQTLASSQLPDTPPEVVASALCALFWLRLADCQEGDVAFQDHLWQGEPTDLQEFFASRVPLHLSPNWEQPLLEQLPEICRHIEQTRRRKTYSRDLIARDPELNADACRFGERSLTLALATSEAEPAAGNGLTITVLDQGATCRWSVPAELCPKAALDQACEHFSTFLNEACTAPTTALYKIPLLDASTLHHLIHDFNQTQKTRTPHTSLHSLVEAQAVASPQEIAVRHDEGELSFADLNQQANQLAHELMTHGVAPGQRVGICLPRSPQLLIAILATLKAGGAYVPLDPDYPPERRHFIAEDAQLCLVLTQSEADDALAGTAPIQLTWNDLHPCLSSHPTSNPKTAFDDSQAAYLLYTSGSTGQPKGVVIPHSAVVNHALDAIERYGIGPDDRVLQFFSINFDGSVEEIFPCLIAGASLVLRNEEMLTSVTAFADFVDEHRISILDLPTAYWHQWVSTLAGSNATIPESIRVVIVGGEKVSQSVYERWRQLAGPQIRWFNTYGPTECTVVASVFEDNADVPEGDLPIGRPIANTELYVVDSHLQPLPIGLPGELLIGGAGVATGYWNRPDLSRERFLPNPFKPDNGRVYRTGDRVRYRANGLVDFIGRRDTQVKIRGFRIEPDEIAATLEQHTAVAQAVVIVRRDESSIPRLAAYWLPATHTQVSPSALRDYLSEHLPEYMLPASLTRLTALPTTPNGKVNLRALPAPAPSDFEHGSTIRPPETPLQATLHTIWQDVLGHDHFGIDDNFFELGGHSLLLLPLMAKIKEQLGQKLAMASLVQHPTIQALASFLDEGEKEAPLSCLVPIRASGSLRPLYFVSGAGGGTHWFHSLLPHLHPQRPLIGLELLGLSPETQEINSVEAMAIELLAKLREAQPHGPYFLGGYSLGGLIAMEMAQLLRRDDEDVAFLCLVESYAPIPPRSTLGWLRCYLHNFMRLDWQEKRFFFSEKLRWFKMLMHNWLATRQASEEKQEFGHLMNAHIQAGLNYQPRYYPDTFLLMRAKRPPNSAPIEPEAGWSDYAKNVRVDQVPGDHYSMFKAEGAKTIATAIEQYLELLELTL
jgi:amino acid adenylation domain-containing protein